jgi:hypothetical protein
MKFELKKQKAALIFIVVFLVSLTVILLFNEGSEGQAIKFNSEKEKSDYCTQLCDKTMQEKPVHESWIECHEDCFAS